MERHPIITQKEAAIRLVKSPLSVTEIFPTYRYEFQSGKVSEEAAHMYSELQEFINTNAELITSEQVNSQEDYVKGLQKALALTRLWIDSIYLSTETK